MCEWVISRRAGCWKARASLFTTCIWRFETPADRQDTLGRSLEQFEQFLGMIALVALVLGAIGVAGAVHTHISRRVPTVAILRCLGCPANLAFAIYLAQTAALGLLGAVVGALIGSGLHAGTLLLVRDELPITLSTAPVWGVVLRTALAGFAVCCGFALVPLLRVREITPAATLRVGTGQESRGDWRRTLPVYLALAALLTLLTVLNSSSLARALGLVAGLAVAFLLLAGVAKLLIIVARRITQPRWPYLLRQGVSNLHRPQNQTLLFLLSLGLGTFLLLTILLSRNLLMERLSIADTRNSPNIYLVDVQPDQVDGVTALLRAKNLPLLESAPMVTMRIDSVRGVPIRELQEKGEIPKWIAQREFRSSYRPNLNATEKITAGQWLTALPAGDGPVPISMEQEIARDLKVRVGDELVLDVQGVQMKVRIASLREVDWSRFNLNFFMIFPPGVLEGAPGFHVLTTRVPEGVSSGELQRSLVDDFANVSAIDLTLVLETVRGILERIGRIIQVLAFFTVLAGAAILVGTLLNSREQRLRESVLLRTLGASARQVRTILTIEYAALGLLSALSGVLLASAANVVLALFVFEASPWPSGLLLASAVAVVTALAVGGGLLLSRGVCTHSPLEILRDSSG
jgi:putative ABC transport system permease protein